VNHVVCYCEDCQAYAHFLGRAHDVLDARGGSEIVQMAPSALTLTQGAERLACIQMTGRGPLRWYAACCNTPIGNTAVSPKTPFVGLVSACLKPDERPLSDSFGPVSMWVFTGGAKGEPKPAPTPLIKLILSVVRISLGARLRGDTRTPFFDARTGKPVAEPRRLGADERARLIAALEGV
jgi:hypothetical protein